MNEGPRLRIGELSRRVGVSPELLRAWEARYGLLRPERTSGGLRLFSQEDERRVQMMRRHLAEGLSAAEAARLAKLESASGREDPASLVELETALALAVEALDEASAQAALDQLFNDFELQTALSQVILPFLHRLGERWASTDVSVAQEHFASHVVGGRLRGLTRGWGDGVGPRAILACPPGEQHDLGLLCFGLTLREHGWRITYLGADTPVQDIIAVLGELSPSVVVLSAVSTRPFRGASREIATLRSLVRVAIGGAGSTSRMAARLGVQWLGEDAIGAAASLTPDPGRAPALPPNP
jgi:DNA-binding transcriptional MerR regulator